MTSTVRTIDQKEILAIKELSTEYIREILDDLGVEIIDRGTYFSTRCPVHGGEKMGGMTITKGGIWKCWTNQCHKKHGFDMIGLIRAVKEISFVEAYDYLVDLLEVDLSKLEELKERASNKAFINKVVSQKIEFDYYDELDMKSFCADEYLIKERGFIKETVDFYEVKFCSDGKHEFWNRTVIPVKDDKGIVGFTGRLSKGKVKDYLSKWRNEGPLHNYLFNYNNARASMKELQYAVLTEGALAPMRLREAGILNAVSLLGSDVHPAQLKILLESEIYQLVICLDNDEAGQEATKKAIATLSKYFYCIPWDIAPHKDLDEMNVTQIKESFGEVEKCLR
jgi:DNA primase